MYQQHKPLCGGRGGGTSTNHIILNKIHCKAIMTSFTYMCIQRISWGEGGGGEVGPAP